MDINNIGINNRFLNNIYFNGIYSELYKNRYISVDSNSDGIIDYYIYPYLYTEQNSLFTLTTTERTIGKVYFYVNIDADFFENPNNIPKDFNKNTDLLIGDFTNQDNPNLYAYQAQNVNSKYRKKIIETMQMYDKDFNTSWERTNSSLLVEWEEHHRYAIFDDSAKNIDFDNNEEGYTYVDYFKKAASRGFNKIVNKINSIF